eukprot:gnl/Spiro4/3777_TR1859_c0_g1_i1.p1 gnl/Spiro4/3777_TR1859_c0_g1~~gnl/Spiro4/3777_TR1859_c0_g1_i1.p1  ORF type:complete len:289 (+),score=73.10 gnl/Spiro4/3777_TR1859_c0_g1_i1:82-867(+)
MSFLTNLFGRQPTIQEQIRTHKRTLNKAERELDRERTRLQEQEKKLIADIKRMAKANQLDAAKVLARDLVRTRSYITKFYRMRASLQAVGLRLQTAQSTQALTQAMSGAAKAMGALNKQLNIPAIQKTMTEFTKSNELMDMKEEMIGDALDEVMDDQGDEEEETNTILAQVFDEIGINLDQQLVSAPSSVPAAAAKSAPAQRQAQPQSATAPAAPPPGPSAAPRPPPPSGGGGGGAPPPTGAPPPADDLAARLDNLKRGNQ